jgi:hypothetical protein
MEMTRRKLVRGIAAAMSSLGLGLWWVARAVSPRRCVRAERVERYPGKIVPMGDIRNPAKWSG